MSVSLQSALRTCTVDHNKTHSSHSARWLDPSQNVCPVWHGKDSLGRDAHPNSYKNKAAGCHHPSDRVDVENSHRPKYFQYTTLHAGGLDGGGDHGYAQPHNTTVDTVHANVGSFGHNYGNHLKTGSSGANTRFLHSAATAQSADARKCGSGF